MSETPGGSRPYPTMDAPLTLESGTVIRVRNIVLYRGQQSSGLTLCVETPTPASDTKEVAQEARELAQLHDEYARRVGASRIAIGVCRTQACLEMSEIPPEMYHFRRDEDGRWSEATDW